MKTIIYSCPYVPAEWITSHGLQPSRIMPKAASSVRSIIPVEGVCPYVRAFINDVITGQKACGVVVTTVCDQMRRAFDIIERRCEMPAFLMNVPNTWQSVTAQKLYLDELQRLGQFLIRLGGKSPSNEKLLKVMLKYDTARASIRAARGYLSSRQYSEAIAEFNRNSVDKYLAPLVRAEPAGARRFTWGSLQTKGVPLAIVGGPLFKQDFQIFDIIENFGGRIVLDATETGERGMCVPFDYRRLHDEPLMELVNAYFFGIQDVSRRPNSQLYEWLKREFDSREVRGIIFRRYLWCDMWHAELRRLKDWINLPVLDIDIADDNEANYRRMANRICTFLEMLK